MLDTYIAGDEIGIVEIGCICHAGFYEANIMKLVNALDSMTPKERKKYWLLKKSRDFIKTIQKF